MGTQTLLTMEQFAALPDYNERTGERYELAHGVLITAPPALSDHEHVKNQIARMLYRFAYESGLKGMLLVESGFVLDELSYRVPDLAYVTADRYRQREAGKPFLFAPNLTIEVISPSETGPSIAQKIDHFLASGTEVAWVVYPKRREVHVDRVGQQTVRLAAHDYLEAPDLLPGLRLRVGDLFED